MGGIVFFKTKDLNTIEDFYIEKLHMKIWLTLKDGSILQQGNLLLGFQQDATAETMGTITLFYQTRGEVEKMRQLLVDFVESPPQKDAEELIYYFYAKDPEGRTLKIQTFLQPTKAHMEGGQLLRTRRSIRYFRNTPVQKTTLWNVLDLARFAPSAKNSQPCYYVIIEKKELLDQLGKLNPPSTEPLGRAPLAVAICADPSISEHYVQDSCIAAYNFMLAAWLHGLGTCWIASMDRDDVKNWLKIPKNHYIATITPLGYPEYVQLTPPRKDVNEIVKFIEE